MLFVQSYLINLWVEPTQHPLIVLTDCIHTIDTSARSYYLCPKLGIIIRNFCLEGNENPVQIHRICSKEAL